MYIYCMHACVIYVYMYTYMYIVCTNLQIYVYICILCIHIHCPLPTAIAYYLLPFTIAIAHHLKGTSTGTAHASIRGPPPEERSSRSHLDTLRNRSCPCGSRASVQLAICIYIFTSTHDNIYIHIYSICYTHVFNSRGLQT